MRGRAADLRGAGIGGDHPREALGQGEGELAAAAAHIEGKVVGRGDVGEEVGQGLRVARPVGGVARGSGARSGP